MHFAAPLEVARHMQGFVAPWCIAGGWALDLFLNAVTRAHADIEILVFREDQLALQRHLCGFALARIVEGRELPWPSGENVEESVHQLRARSVDSGFDIFLGESDGARWIYRRDRRLSCPKNDAIQTAPCGLPILAPEIALLFKAKHLLPKDQADFERVVPLLSGRSLDWLRHGLAQAHPESPGTQAINAGRSLPAASATELHFG